MKLSSLLTIGVFFSFLAPTAHPEPNNGHPAKPGLTVPLELMLIGPHLVADPRRAFWENSPNWAQFERALDEAKAHGVTAISVDVWWALVQIREGNTSDCFNWQYYDKLFQIITSKKLKIAPILSLHTYGTNFNDYGTAINHRPWLIAKMVSNGWGYRSELDNWNYEALSPWSLEQSFPYVHIFWAAFLEQYGHLVPYFSQLIIGMGPAGELVYPSYHEHDLLNSPQGRTNESLFPGRGVLQHRSPLAIASFQRWLRAHYPGGLSQLRAAWGTVGEPYLSGVQNVDQVEILRNFQEVDHFWATYGQYTAMGQDFLDWYHESLILDQGLKLGREAIGFFGRVGSAMRGVPLAMKVGGVHWQYHDRIPMLTAGLATTRGADMSRGKHPLDWQPKSWSREEGGGLGRIFSDVLHPLRSTPYDFRGIFTCGEMQSCRLPCLMHGTPEFAGCSSCRYAPTNYPHARARSGAAELMEAVLTKARSLKIPVAVENAEEGALKNAHSLRVLGDRVAADPNVYEASLLRLYTAMDSDPAKEFLDRMSQVHDRIPPCPEQLLMVRPADTEKTLGAPPQASPTEAGGT